MRRLFEMDIEPKLDETTFCRPNPFRKDHCYKRDVTAVLWAYEPSLRNIFTGVSNAFPKAGAESKLISLDEWKAFMRGLGMVRMHALELP